MRPSFANRHQNSDGTSTNPWPCAYSLEYISAGCPTQPHMQKFTCTHFVRTRQDSQGRGSAQIHGRPRGSRGARQGGWCTQVAGRSAFAATAGQFQMARCHGLAVQSLKRRRWTLLHSCGRGGATLIWMAASSRRLRRPTLLHHSVIGCVTSATFSCASHVPLQEHACHASTTLSVGMGTFAFSVARSISRLPYQTPRPHPTVPIAEQIYLLTYGRSRDWHAEWLRREARNGHRPMAEFEACISDGGAFS